MKHLTKLFEDIQLRCSCLSKIPYTNDLQSRLQTLTSIEKYLIADFVYKQEYDIGTGRILKLLQEINIISVHHYVSNIEDTSLLLNIYNDFLENQPLLFAELVKGATQKNSSSYIQLKATLDYFLEDFVQNFQGLKSNPFKNIRINFESEQYLNKSLLGTFMKNGSISIEKALNEQHVWETEPTDPIQEMIIRDCVLQITPIENLITFIQQFILGRNKTEINWRVYCQVLRVIARIYGSKALPLYRRVLNEEFKKFIKERNDFLLHFTMVTIRQLSLSAPNDFKYGEWYKMNIGEMMYTTTKEEFQYVIKVLTKMIEHEMNENFLSVHINTRIQAPPLCNDIVFTFKAILRSRLDSLGKEQEVIELDE